MNLRDMRTRLKALRVIRDNAELHISKLQKTYKEAGKESLQLLRAISERENEAR